MSKMFEQAHLQAIADALGDTEIGLTGSEIAHLLSTCRIDDVAPTVTKRHRLYNAFAHIQNAKQDRVPILAFIRHAMKPARFIRQQGRYEPMRRHLNVALAFSGLAVRESGELVSVGEAETLSEAKRRASDLRGDLEMRSVHPDVLRFCREELLAENYFHAILEAAKGVADKLRERSGLLDDGATLVDRTLSGNPPLLAINEWSTESDKSEQRGFCNLVKGLFGMFRNTTAHTPRISWAINKEDAEEVFTLLSLVHKRIDSSRMPPRV
ncbi:TIGR02391 family protein [Rhodopseudomonas pseudopalustris]|uniref:TIGR02391 family protein n=1 Tax=Rhodopseudomonas pseudopalustris TaxID=1513892 RepID=A0A1H8WU41_9BRAD|nr:TIGR02391 family protein [Rhodopseudomonas pseudopalustris]SEP31204.1 TIGR02391 family protein [Rhodopseudomonas pseudopalustris]